MGARCAIETFGSCHSISSCWAFLHQSPTCAALALAGVCFFGYTCDANSSSLVSLIAAEACGIRQVRRSLLMLTRMLAVFVVLPVLAFQAEDLKSGPAAGQDLPGAFHAFNVTGAHAG